VSDIFHEVDEEVRREQLNKLWQRHGKLIIAAVILIVIAVAGWRGYRWWEDRRAAETGAAFDAAAELAEQGKPAEAEAAFARIAAQGIVGYRMLARLREAETAAERDAKAAIAAYDAIAADPALEPALRDFAGVRAGLLMLDSAPLDEITRRLEPLAEPGRAFRHTARELLALAAFKAGEGAAARKWYDAIVADAETPQNLRARVEVLMALSGASKS